MKNDIHRLKLYIDLQRIRLLLADPLLKNVCQQMLTRAIELENALVEDRASVAISESSGHLTELLKGKGLFWKRQGAAFFDTHQLTLWTSPLNASGKQQMSSNVDVAVFEVTDAANALNEVKNGKLKCPQAMRTLYVINKDQVADAEVFGRKLALKASRDMAKGKGCEVLLYSARESTQALKMMDDRAPAAAELRAVKLRLLALSNEALDERFRYRFRPEWYSILEVCIQSLQAQIDVHQRYKNELQATRKGLEAGAAEWRASKLDSATKNFGVRVNDLSFSESPANIAQARNIINRAVRDRLNSATGQKAFALGTRTLEAFAESIRNSIIEQTQRFRWLEAAERETMERELRGITPDRIRFTCPYFSMNSSSHLTASGHIDVLDMKKAASEALESYNAALSAELAKVIEDGRQKYLKKLDKFLSELYKSMDAAAAKSQTAATAIESSNVWSGLNALVNEARFDLLRMFRDTVNEVIHRINREELQHESEGNGTVS